MHKSKLPIITLKDITLNFENKELITNSFSSYIYTQQKIAVVGRNGSGKSSLLRAIAGLNKFFDGDIIVDKNTNIGYISQLMNNTQGISGGQLFNRHLSEVIATKPDLLLLDEPTNHLDMNNLQSLFGFIKRFSNTLIIVTHDLELLEHVDIIWHIHNHKITVFNGKYSDYITTHKQDLVNLNDITRQLKIEKKKSHAKLMVEQQRAKKKKNHGEKKYDGDKLALRSAQGRGERTANKNTAQINYDKSLINQTLDEIYIPEVIIPKFHLPFGTINSSKNVISIINGSICYDKSQCIVSNINLQLTATQKIALVGCNGCGKSTLIRAILQDVVVKIDGEWQIPNTRDIGYVDQFYANLTPSLTSVEMLQQLTPQWSYAEIRDHLNTFLLRRNEEVNLQTKYLSGGEKLRLSLALIAAKPPKLLLLDEVTNNIDLETKEHLLQVLNIYPGAMILICHENAFLQKLSIDTIYVIEDGQFSHTTL